MLSLKSICSLLCSSFGSFISVCSLLWFTFFVICALWESPRKSCYTADRLSLWFCGGKYWSFHLMSLTSLPATGTSEFYPQSLKEKKDQNNVHRMPSNNNSVVAAEMPFFDIKVVWTIRFVKQVTKCMLLLIFSNNFSMGWNQFWRNICICNYCESKTKLSFTNCLNPFESFPLSFHALVFHFLVKATATAEKVCKQEL